MESINSGSGLNDAISKLEQQRDEEEKVMRDKLHSTYESMQPVNLIKTTYHEIMKSPDAAGFKKEIMDTTLGLAAGYVSKKIFDGNTHSPARKIAGVALQLAVTNAVRHHPEEIRTVGRMFFNMLRDSRRKLLPS